MLPPGVMLAGAVFVIARSAETETVAFDVALLLPAFGSLVVEEKVAVFEIVVPFGVAALTASVSVNVAVAPFASVAVVQVIVPVPPPAGVVQLQPAGEESEVNVVFAGVASFKARLCASVGPLLVTLIV
jgi:hypothetical protein